MKQIQASDAFDLHCRESKIAITASKIVICCPYCPPTYWRKGMMHPEPIQLEPIRDN